MISKYRIQYTIRITMKNRALNLITLFAITIIAKYPNLLWVSIKPDRLKRLERPVAYEATAKHNKAFAKSPANKKGAVSLFLWYMSKESPRYKYSNGAMPERKIKAANPETPNIKNLISIFGWIFLFFK